MVPAELQFVSFAFVLLVHCLFIFATLYTYIYTYVYEKRC